MMYVLLVCVWLTTKAGKGHEREGEDAGVSLTGGAEDPASPAALVHKADR